MSTGFIDEWDANFKGRGSEFKTGPVMDRQCKDVCCVVTFFVLLLGFIGLGAWFMYTFSTYTALVSPGTPQYLPGFDDQNIGTFVGIAIGMIVLSIFLAVLFIVLTKAFPKGMVYGMIIFSILLFLAVAAALLAMASWVLGIFVVVVMLIYILVLWCCLWKHIDTSVVLVKCTAAFISDRPQVYLVALGACLITIGFEVYWLFGMIGLMQLGTHGIITQNMYGYFQIIWYALYVFFTYFFYYTMVFLVAASVCMWYYKASGSTLGQACSWWVKHVGSITFAAVLITIIKVMQRLIGDEDSKNPCLRICLCIIKYVLASLEYLVKVINHYATIVMTFTGDGFVEAAKNAGVILFDNMGLFATVNIISGFFFFVGVLICVGVPTALSIVFLNLSGYSVLVVYMLIIVLLFSLITSLMFVSTFVEALAAVFVFFCMDKKFAQYGIMQMNAPDEVRNLFNEINGDHSTTQVMQVNNNLNATQVQMYEPKGQTFNNVLFTGN